MIEPGQAPELGQVQGPAHSAWHLTVREMAQNRHAAPERCSMPIQDLAQTQQAYQQSGPLLSDLEDHESLQQ